MLSLSTVMVAVFLSHVDEGGYTLPVHYIMMGVINPLGFAAMRMQAVAIAFPPDVCPGDGRQFCPSPALALGGAAAVYRSRRGALVLRERAESGCRRHRDGHAGDGRRRGHSAALQALRGHAEGMAALRRRPNAIMAGQAMYLASIVILLFSLLETRAVPGYLMGGVSVMVAIAISQLTVRAALVWNDFEDSYGDPSRRAPGISGQPR